MTKHFSLLVCILLFDLLCILDYLTPDVQGNAKYWLSEQKLWKHCHREIRYTSKLSLQYTVCLRPILNILLFEIYSHEKEGKIIRLIMIVLHFLREYFCICVFRNWKLTTLSILRNTILNISNINKRWRLEWTICKIDIPVLSPFSQHFRRPRHEFCIFADFSPFGSSRANNVIMATKLKTPFFCIAIKSSLIVQKGK